MISLHFQVALVSLNSGILNDNSWMASEDERSECWNWMMNEEENGDNWRHFDHRMTFLQRKKRHKVLEEMMNDLRM